MKFTCEKSILQKAINIVLRSVAVKSSVPALEGILLEAENGLKMTGYNLKIGITTTVDADIQEEGKLVLSARLFNDIIRKMPDELVTVYSEKNTAHLKCGNAEFNILSIDAAEFPQLPEEEKKTGFSICQASLKKMLSQSLFAVSADDSRPIYTGSLFEVGQDELTIVSVDGFRLALRREKLDQNTEQENISFIVPGEALTEVEKICDDSENQITISLGEHFILFQTEDISLISRRLEGEFLNYRATIPSDNPIHVVAQTRDMLDAIERVSLIINENNKCPLKCLFDDGILYISAKTAIGDASDSCPIEGDGQKLEIGFNNRYLMDALHNAPGEKVKINMNSSVSPCVILPADGEPDNFLYMVLPVRLKAGM